MPFLFRQHYRDGVRSLATFVCVVNINLPKIQTMKIGKKITLSIQTIALGGDGVGRLDNLVVFVPFTAEGDLCEVEIIAAKKKFMRGRLVRIIKPSPSRTQPLCQYYTICGGCQYQHINYEDQLAIKRRQISETFERIGKVKNPEVREVLPSLKSYHYRGKAEFQISSLMRHPAIGFFDTTGSEILEIDRCKIADESINKKLLELKEALASNRARLTSNRCTIWSDADYFVPGAASPTQSIERMVKGISFQAPYEGFFQVNTLIVDKMVDVVAEMCGLDGHETVLDVYCGSGLFSIFLASSARQIYGIDSDDAAIAYAEINSSLQGLKNVLFYCGDAAEIIERRVLRTGIEIDCIILDPPRSGCEKEVLDALVALKPRRIIYVSCNPATQARDASHLITCGAELKYIQPLDMFPQTAHIESIALLEIK